ncbi:hypothetical protein D3C75_888650 [compost metagenome]
MGVEGDEGLAGQVVGAEKGAHDGRGGFTPDRKAEIDRVVVAEGVNLVLQLGLEAAVTLLTRLLHGLQIVLRVGVGRANLEEIGTQSTLDQPGDHAGIARAREVRDQNPRA